MDEREKVAFIKAQVDNITYKILEAIHNNKIPEHWEGKQLRRLIVDKAKEQDLFPMSPKELKEYENVFNVNNL